MRKNSVTLFCLKKVMKFNHAKATCTAGVPEFFARHGTVLRKTKVTQIVSQVERKSMGLRAFAQSRVTAGLERFLVNS